MAFLWHQQSTSELSKTMSFTTTEAEHLLIVGKVRFYEEDEQTDGCPDGQLLFSTQTLIPRETALYCLLKQSNT